MATSLPLFDRTELSRIVCECDRLRAKLRRGGMEARSRIRTEQKLAMNLVRQLQLETKLDLGGRYVRPS